MDGEGWHHGVYGHRCSRLVEKYGRPAFLIATDGDRGPLLRTQHAGVSLIEAVACGKD
ncbi:MAG: hypothetical protein V8Q30_07790 [Acutalibacteraceae bacterium]